MELSSEFKQRVRAEMLKRRGNFGGSDAEYAQTLGIDASSYNKLKKGVLEKVISSERFIHIGRLLHIDPRPSTWKVAKTLVYEEIASSLNFCQTHSQSQILTDSWGIGKTFCAKHVIKTLRNAFYLDCSQSKTKQLFIRQLAKCIGANHKGRFYDVKTGLKYHLNALEKPLVVLDDAGDLDYPAFLELKELWNGTEGSCAWYLIGDDSLEEKIKRGIENKKVGFGAIFSRFSEEYLRILPHNDIQEKKAYLKRMMTDVAVLNLLHSEKVAPLVNKCLGKGGSLRRLTTLVKLNNETAPLKIES